MTVLEVRVPYERYARLLRWLVLSLAAYVAVLFSVHVPWGEVARHTLVPPLIWRPGTPGCARRCLRHDDLSVPLLLAGRGGGGGTPGCSGSQRDPPDAP